MEQKQGIGTEDGFGIFIVPKVAKNIAKKRFIQGSINVARREVRDKWSTIWNNKREVVEKERLHGKMSTFILPITTVILCYSINSNIACGAAIMYITTSIFSFCQDAYRIGQRPSVVTPSSQSSKLSKEDLEQLRHFVCFRKNFETDFTTCS